MLLENGKSRPMAVPLNGVPQIPDYARELFRRDIMPSAQMERDCEVAIDAACLEITERYRQKKIERK